VHHVSRPQHHPEGVQVRFPQLGLERGLLPSQLSVQDTDFRPGGPYIDDKHDLLHLAFAPHFAPHFTLAGFHLLAQQYRLAVF